MEPTSKESLPVRVSNESLAVYVAEMQSAKEKLGLEAAQDFNLDTALDLLDARAENARLTAELAEARTALNEMAGKLAEATKDSERLMVAFVQGAKWWEWISRGATMWQNNQHEAARKAQEMLADGTLGVTLEERIAKAALAAKEQG